ncbi:conjugal transfer protein TrbJ [Ralstonia sp. 1138]|uniref:conjugal transfer protein TrbJ n=1 Tax=Ralstonia sp. 1138 TaxID=3156423 RepID=UPI003393E83E
MLATTALPTRAGSVAGTGGATEVTQLLNHLELVDSVAQQAQMVQTQLNQYATMVQQLQQIPQSLLGSVTMPWQKLVATYQGLANTVGSVQRTFNNAYQVLQYRQGQMDALHMNPNQYLNAELQLAQTKGGAYQDQIQRDLQALNDAQTQASALSAMTSQISAITGSVQGLQHLATQSSMIGGVLMDIRRLTLEHQLALGNDQYKRAQDDQFLRAKELLMLQQATDRGAEIQRTDPTIHFKTQW